jgi:hypothetical protein
MATVALTFLALLALLSASDRSAAAPAPFLDHPATQSDKAVLHHGASPRPHASVTSMARPAWLSTRPSRPAATPPIELAGGGRSEARSDTHGPRPSPRGPPR